MAEIKNPMAYFKVVGRNSYHDEQRSNSKFNDHISSVGDETDIQRVFAAQERKFGHNDNSIEPRLCDASVENWLLLMEDERLLTALHSLPRADVEFLLELANLRFEQKDLARLRGVSKQAISQRKKRIFRKIMKFF